MVSWFNHTKPGTALGEFPNGGLCPNGEITAGRIWVGRAGRRAVWRQGAAGRGLRGAAENRRPAGFSFLLPHTCQEESESCV